MRHYDSALAAALDNNNVDTAVYYNLIEAVHENMDAMYKYVRLRKKLLGVEELHMYDLYTPIVSDAYLLLLSLQQHRHPSCLQD